jgi:hypothetical protein
MRIRLWIQQNDADPAPQHWQNKELTLIICIVNILWTKQIQINPD